LPSLFNAVEIPQDDGKLMLEVQGHIGKQLDALSGADADDGLSRGAEAIDTASR
jgi:F-type H+-transporting ATPase subunit beta